MIQNKIPSKEILLLEPSDDHTHARTHTNVLSCCGTVRDRILNWNSLRNSAMFNHILYGTPPPSTSRLHTTASDHNADPSTADLNILLKVRAKTRFFPEQIKNLWRTGFS
jgi:hypothetical protein